MQFGVELQHVSQLAVVPPEKVSANPNPPNPNPNPNPKPSLSLTLTLTLTLTKVSAEVVEAARRIGQALYQLLPLPLTLSLNST